MTGPPNFAVGPIILTTDRHCISTADTLLAPLAEKLEYHKIETNISRVYENLAICSRLKLCELLHMKVSVSEPCDVIRVGGGRVFAKSSFQKTATAY